MRIDFEKENCRAAAYDGETLIGVCEFEPEGKRWTITHTETEPSYGGRGIARELVLCVSGRAREEGADIVPACSYARKVLNG